MSRLFRRLAVGCWYACAALVIAVAVLIGMARLLLPWADRLRGDVETWVTAQFGQPVTIEAFDAAWWGAGPVLKLRGIRLLGKQAEETLLSVDELRIAISLYDSLRTARIAPNGFQIVGIHLAIERHADGVITLQGHKPSDDGSSSEAMEWLLGLGQVHIRGGEIVWRDAHMGGRPLRFSNVDFVLRGHGAQRRLKGSADLPAQLGHRLEFALEFQEGLKSPRDWAGNLYLNVSSLQLAGWPLTLPGAMRTAGAVDLELWSEWRQAHPVKLEGRFGVRNLEITGMQEARTPGEAARHVAVDRVQGQVLWRQEASGWQLELDKFSLVRDGRSCPETRLSAAAVTDPEGRLLSVRAQAGFVALEDVVALLQAGPWLPERLRAFLAGMQPHGELRELQLSYRARDGEPALSLQTRFDRAGGRAWRALPALDGLSGVLKADERSGVIVLDSRMARAEFPRLFRNPLEAAQLSGTLAWERDSDVWRLHSDELVANNADIRTRTRVAVEIPTNGSEVSPFLDLQVAFEEGEVSHVYRYLPTGIMGPAVVRWLDRALVSGRVASGTALFHGRLKDFPFDRGTGKFEVRFNVADAILDYQPQWPRIEELEAEVEFSGRSMSIRAVGGKIFNTDLLRARVRIPTLQHHARLTVQGRVQGPLADMLRVLKEGPLAEKYGTALEGVRAEGGALLNLDLDLALYEGGEERVGGSVEFRDAALIAERWDAALTQIAGPLTFGEPGLTAQSLKAHLFGQKVRIQVHPVNVGAEKTATEVKVRGPDLAGLASHFQFAILPYVQGTAEWEARLRIQPGAHAWQEPAIRLAFESDLEGMSVSLPEPLGKAAEQARTLTVRTELSATQPQMVAIRYDSLLDGLLELQRGAGGVTLQRGALRFGGGEASLPSSPGLQITGRLRSVSLDAWRDWLNTAADGGREAGLAERLDFLDLSVGRLGAFKQSFEDIRVAARKTMSEWIVRVEGMDAAGTIRVPHPWTAAARVVMDFDRLRLRAPRPGAHEQSPPSPHGVPALQVASKRLIYDATDFGSLSLQVSPRSDGIRLDQLLLRSPVLQVKAQGSWIEKQGRHESDLEIELDSTNLAGALESLGYAAGVSGGGPGHVEIKAAWPGAPNQFSPEHMDGRLYMMIGKGRFLDIEPGVGRVFGLLSLNALPRRLMLDFSDLFRKGFTFDRIEGHFSITGGDAYTNDLYMEGPSAHVNVVGRAGLISRDYDQIVTVTPRIGSSLPLAGMLAGGPNMGAVLFLAEKLLGTQIDRATRTQYTVTGSWDAPVIERVRPNSKASKAVGP